MTLKRDTPCQGGCGKVRSILFSDSPADWLCYDCRTRGRVATPDEKPEEPRQVMEAEADYSTGYDDVQSLG